MSGRDLCLGDRQQSRRRRRFAGSLTPDRASVAEVQMQQFQTISQMRVPRPWQLSGSDVLHLLQLPTRIDSRGAEALLRSEFEKSPPLQFVLPSTDFKASASLPRCFDQLHPPFIERVGSTRYEATKLLDVSQKFTDLLIAHLLRCRPCVDHFAGTDR